MLPFIKTYPVDSEREGEEHTITLALYPTEATMWEGEIVATWNDNGVARLLDPTAFRAMSIRTLVPSNKLQQIFMEYMQEHYAEYESTKEDDGEPD